MQVHDRRLRRIRHDLDTWHSAKRSRIAPVVASAAPLSVAPASVPGVPGVLAGEPSQAQTTERAITTRARVMLELQNERYRRA